LELDSSVKLVCPGCKEALSEFENGYKCVRCLRFYPVKEGLPHLLCSIDDEFKTLQKNIYEKNINETAPLQASIDKNGFLYPTTLKLAKIAGLLRDLNLSPDSYVLDAGCGDGRLLVRMVCQYQVRAFGIDISSAQLLQNLKTLGPLTNYYVADAENLPFENNTFDFIFSFDVLEHLSSPGDCIREICRVLKKGGKALLYVISSREKYTWHWVLRKISANRWGVDEGRFGDHRKENFLSPEDIFEFATANNASVGKIVYFHSFFTIAFDEMYRFLVSSYRSSKIAKSRLVFSNSRKDKKMQDISFSLKIWSLFVKTMVWPLDFLDRMWYQKGYSNGFFIEIVKK
jgi:SAM-dependent methyltransferase